MKEPIDADRQVLVFEQVLAAVSRRRCISQDEADEFVSWARERFVTGRETIFATFRGQAKATTYLTIVVVNLLRDYRTKRWGKWRPSAAADRMGAVAIRLEQLITRDGLSTDEAIEMVRRNEGVREPLAELHQIAERLPPRLVRRFEGEQTLERLSAEDRADRHVEAEENRKAAARIETALEVSLQGLAAEDQLILQLHIGKGFTIAEVARALRLDQKPLYRRLHQLLGRLRAELEGRGIRGEDVAKIVGAEGAEIRLAEMHSDESAPSRPSQGLER